MARGDGARGTGPTQDHILRLVRARGSFYTTHQLAVELNLSYRRIQYAVHALAERGLVELTLEPTLRVWVPGATEKRRSYARSVGADWARQQLRRPPHCGPGCVQNHVGADKPHMA